MKERKKLSIVGLLLVIVAIIACALVSWRGVGEHHDGSAQNIILGLDLAGGVSITYQAKDANPSQSDMDDTVYKLQQRVAVYSNEAQVYQEGINRISVEIPGVYDADTILSTLGNPGSISFQEIVEETVDTDSDAADSEVEDESSDETEADEPVSYFSEVLNGEDIVTADVRTQTDQTYGTQKYVVRLQLNSEGAKKFEEATARNIDKSIYIIYDNQIISYPKVNSVITGGEAIIEGNFTYESANSLATTIRNGVLNLELEAVHSTVVGAQLGEEALSTSLVAGAIGVGLVIIFMIIVYHVLGLASGIALLLYLTSMLCFLNALDITLTLPGIAGIILSLGMAVDANVVIFARIREEIAEGKVVREAIRLGFRRAASAIIDGNVTTLIAAAVLWLMGTGSIKGFATTLALGIVLSMFTAMVVTRIVISGLYALGIRSEKAYGRQKPVKVIPFVEHKKLFFIISGVVIIFGFVMMGVNHARGMGAMNFGLDFTGGTSMTLATNDYIDTRSDAGNELRQLIEDTTGTADIQLQNVQDSNEIIIKTSVLEQDQRADLRAALAEKYDIEENTIAEESISAVISNDMQRDAVVSVIIAGICMLIYIWIRFRDLKFGFSAVLALLHDVLVVLMVYTVVRISVGNTFIACMLTIVGYSINATIVIFDRIRENKKTMRESLDVIVNTSISQTLSRSINTSVTTFITIFVLYILGVSSIREFALPLMAGVVCGAYSSICVTGALYYVMKKAEKKQK